MNRTPVADWQQLSALYELADTLDPDLLDDWLAKLRQQSHPLLAQLEQMLDARSQIRRNGFLGELPRVPTRPEPRALEWLAGRRIGPYCLLRKIGSGGMAEVWLAQRDDGAFQRQVAIKLLFRHAGSDALDTFAQRFERERDILASLNHPHIAGLHDAGVTPGGQPWLALEYVEGETLTAWCDARQLTVEARVRLFRQVLLAVQYAHASLVIHRDLKPANILVTAQGDVRLLDFGIAKLMAQEGDALAETELTRIAGRPMTPQYAAPEQLMGQPLTTACDVYSLGVVLYELLCGERPYELKVESTAQLEQAILDTEPRAPSRRALTGSAATVRGTTGALLRKLLASDIDAIVLRALAKQPAQRYGSVEALRADLDRWLGGEPVEARAPSTAYRVGKFVRRHVLGVSLGAGAVAALVGVATVAVVMGLDARRESMRAIAARDFMIGMFRHADADKSRGADITARELLDLGRDDVTRRLSRQPELQVDLLQGIAHIQGDMQEFAKADLTLDQLARLQLSIHQRQAAALTLAMRSDNALRMGNDRLAQALVRQAGETLGSETAEAPVRAVLGLTRGWIALRQGEPDLAKENFFKTIQDAGKAGGSYRSTAIDARSGLIKAEQALRHFDLALSSHAELAAFVTQGTDFTPRDQAVLDIGRVELLVAAGRFHEALDEDIAVLDRCEASLGPNDSECRRLGYSRTSVMLRLGWLERARAGLGVLEQVAQDGSSPDAQAAAVLTAYRGFSSLRELSRHRGLVASVVAIGDASNESRLNASRRAFALLVLAENGLRDDLKDQGVRPLLERALAMEQLTANGRIAPQVQALTRALMGIACMKERQFEKAQAWFRQAREIAAAALGPLHSTVLLYSLDEAAALAKLGHVDAASAMIANARAPLRRALGEDAPIYQRLLTFENAPDRKDRAQSADIRFDDFFL